MTVFGKSDQLARKTKFLFFCYVTFYVHRRCQYGLHGHFNCFYRPESDTSGQQCCYGTDGILAQQPVGGSADKISPIRSYYGHIIQDLVPFIHCCKESNFPTCPNYFRQRPGGSSIGYFLIPPGKADMNKLN